MPNVVYVTPDKRRVEVFVEVGSNVMQGAIDNQIEGILGDCGGACSCATCHCYVDPAWAGKLDEASEMEINLLDCVADPNELSRLSCQIVLRSEMDGIVVYIPTSQV